LEDFTNKE